MNDPAIKVEGLTKRFGDFVAVDDVDFEAAEGKITALLGPSGSGKSTVLRMIAGLETPTAGRIWMEAEEHTHTSVQERRVGFVFQHFALFRHMTVAQNVGFGLAVRKAGRDEIRDRVDELLALVQLSPFRDRYPDQLSGGQRQRVALARALAPRPQVLLLDEPFGALDARVRQDLRRWLDDLHRELGVTSLLVTHDQDEALELAHRIVVMHEGGIQQIGTPAEIYNEPTTAFVAGFVGSANVLQGHVSNGQVRFGDHGVAGAGHLEEGAAARAFVRPHDVVVSTVVHNGGSVRATVERVRTLGWVSRVSLRLPDGQVLMAELPNEELEALEVGTQVWVDLRHAKAFQASEMVGASPAA
ncbi:MAG: sulfate/molybdate ABC transporter ATP-binding protein [Actinomycetota bacterium]